MEEVLGVQCPTCKALPGEKCHSWLRPDDEVKEPHNRRVEASCPKTSEKSESSAGSS